MKQVMMLGIILVFYLIFNPSYAEGSAQVVKKNSHWAKVIEKPFYPGGPGGSYGVDLHTQLNVDYYVYKVGEGHVTGIIYTTDGWKTTHETVGRWVYNSKNGTPNSKYIHGPYEHWNAYVSIYKRHNWVYSIDPHEVNFEYVIYCTDYKGVKTIWDNNNGNLYKITTVFSREY